MGLTETYPLQIRNYDCFPGHSSFRTRVLGVITHVLRFKSSLER